MIAIAIAAAVASAVAGASAPSPAVAQFAAQSPASTNTIPGLTRWVWNLGSPLPEWPVVVEGQTPNAYDIVPSVADMRDPLPCAEGDLADYFAGELRGWLRIDNPGEYAFELIADDGARLEVNGAELADTWKQPGYRARASLQLNAGLHALRVPFFENAGKFRLQLRWQTPGATAFTDIPADNLRTEPGQTFVVSPGPKRWNRASAMRAPGDTRPLNAPHPAYRLEPFHRAQFEPHVGALCFMPNGELAVASWASDGAVYILDAQGNERIFARGLGEPLGLAWVNNALHVTQKGEVTRIEDTDGDGTADTFTPVAQGFPQSPNYHEFTFNLVPWQGKLWFATSVPLRSGLTNYMPGSDGDFTAPNGPGSLWSVDPATGTVTREASGLRTPNGMGVGVDGELFGCDNQGSWLPASRMNHLVPGGFYGHQEMRGEAREAMPPVVWFPQGEIGNSPSEPVLVHDGPHRGQMYVGDVTYGGVQRVHVERVQGAVNAPAATSPPQRAQAPRYQGTVFMHSQGLEAGVNRLAWGPDGALYVGGVGSNGNWNHLGRTHGLERLVPAWRAADGPDSARATAFEMLRVNVAPDGLLLTFSAPVAADMLADATRYQVDAWHYEPSEAYGGPKVGAHRIQVTRAEPSGDGRQVRLRLEPFAAGEVVHLRLRDVVSRDGAKPWATESWTTVNALPTREPVFERFVGSPARPENAIVLLDPGTDATQFRRAAASAPIAPDAPDAPDTSDARQSPDAPEWRFERGDLIVKHPSEGIGQHDLLSRRTFGDVFVHLEWLSPPGGNPKDGQRNGNSGIKLAERYEVQIMNTPMAPHAPAFNEAGAIYRQAAPATNASTGAGTWQSYDIWFTAPKWEGDRKIADARMTVLWNGVLVHDDVAVPKPTGMSAPESPGPSPILLQSHASDCPDPVRFRNIWAAEGANMPPKPTRR